MFLHFIETHVCILNHAARALLSRFYTKLYFRVIYHIFYGINFILCQYGMCLLVYCDIILCFRQGSKLEQFHWLVIHCMNISEIKDNKMCFVIIFIMHIEEAWTRWLIFCRWRFQRSCTKPSKLTSPVRVETCIKSAKNTCDDKLL